MLSLVAPAHDGNLNEPMRVLQIGGVLVPFVWLVKYSVVYQKVQPSDGSTLIEL